MIARGELEGDVDDDVDTSMSDSISIASHDQHTCKRCDKPVYGLVRLCPEHQNEYEREQREAEEREERMRQETFRRKEQSLRQQQDRAASSSAAALPHAVTPTLTSVPSATDQGSRYSIMVSPYGTPMRDNVKSEASMGHTAVPPSQPPPTKPVDMPKLVHDSWPQYAGPTDRVKQEEEVRATRQKREEFERVSMLSDVDKYEEATSVLGTILSRAFTTEMRRMMRYGKLPPTIKLSGKDRIIAMGEMKAHGNTFSGERMKAAFYLRKLCSSIIRYDFSIGEVYTVMSLTMIGQADSWLQGA